VVGPGTNTSATTAAMLAAAEAIVAAGLRPEHDLVFAAVAQEETGLVGMRRLYDEYRDRAVAFVDILGDGRSISYGALGIHWWRVIAHGPPGHSLGGGLPNVNQGIGRAVDRILQLPQPRRHAERRTIVNVAMLNSGSVFNHKPETGWFSLDIRSLDAEVIEEIEAEVRAILAGVEEETTIRFEKEPFQITPGGQIPGARESALVRTAVEIARHLGLGEPTLSDAGSANLNIAIAGGTPAIGLGGERGGARGQPAEWADIPSMMRSARHILLLAATRGGASGN
jgi:acetylornithine deacetylase/succinyl-diaminopimelate desuccinylase-like protein